MRYRLRLWASVGLLLGWAGLAEAQQPPPTAIWGRTSSTTTPTRAFRVDPCQANAKVYLPVATTGSAQIITGTAAQKIYLCSVSMWAGGAETFSIVAGTGTVCATATVAVIGFTTGSGGMRVDTASPFFAGTGEVAIAATTVNGDNLCVLQAAAAALSGVITYVKSTVQ